MEGLCSTQIHGRRTVLNSDQGGFIGRFSDLKNTDKTVQRPKLVKNRVPTIQPRPRLKRFLIASVFLHAVLQVWTLVYLYLNEPSPEAQHKMRMTVAFDPAEDSPQPEVVEHIDPPMPKEVNEVPKFEVVDEPIEPAPWLKPKKTEDTFLPPVLGRQRPPRVSGLSARYRRKEKQPQGSKVQPSAPKMAAQKTPKRSAPKPQAIIIARKLKGSCPRPHYPRRALRRGLSGRVTFLVDVGVNGEVLSIQLEKSSGHDILDRAARAAIKKWKFVPATQGGKAVRDRVRVPMSFILPQ